MKEIFKRLWLGMLLLCAFLVVGCSDDKNDTPDEPEGPESMPVEAYDDLEYLSESLVERDENGNFIRYVIGRAIDEANPGALSIGADNVEEAKEIFYSLLAPGYESNITNTENGEIKYRLTSEEGVVQGVATFTAESEENRIASVRFSEGAKIDDVKSIFFILSSSWPENAANCFSPYAVGDIINFNTDEMGEKWDGMQKAIVIREAKIDQCGLILHLSNQKWQVPGAHVYEGLPSVSMAQTCASIIGGNWSVWQTRYKNIGYDIDDGDWFWIDKRKLIPPFSHRRYAVKVSEKNSKKNTDWFDTMYKHPKKKYMMVKTFEAVYE